MITFANGTRAYEDPNAPGSYAVEASAVGLAPGEWPERITVTLEARGMEPAMPLDLDRVRFPQRDAEGEIVEWAYVSGLGGYVLEVIND